MIRNFASKTARDIFDGVESRHARHIDSRLHGKILRLFDQLNVARTLEALRIPPSNRLEKLEGDMKEFWSLRINRQWRIVFRWEKNHATYVDILDYH